MDALFLSMLDRSISGSLVVLAVLLLRLVLKKAPKWLHCTLWALVAFRLVCPVSIESSVSLMPEREKIQSQTGEIAEIYSAAGPEAEPDIESENYIWHKTNIWYETAELDGTSRITGPAVVTEEPGIHWPGIGSIVWLTGAGLLLLYAAVSYLRLRKQVRASMELGNGVYLCDYIDTPFILGILRPRIYLPSEMNPKDAAHVLAHEKAHLTRKDHWWKPLGFCLLSAYWFNPVLWLAYWLLCRDIELACDERVVKSMPLPDKKAYSEALLKCSVPRHRIVSCPLAFGEVGVRERVKNVLHYKKPAFWIVLAAVMLSLIAAVCFLTDPQEHTLYRFLDVQERKLTEIQVNTMDGMLHLDSDAEYAPLLAILEETQYDTTPVSAEKISGTTDEYGWMYPSVTMYYGEKTEVLFLSFDYTQVWKADAEGTTCPYPVTNPAALRSYLETYGRAVKQESCSVASFATRQDAAQWAAGLNTDAVLNGQFLFTYADSTMRGSTLTYGYLNEFLSLLNTLPADAFTEIGADESFIYSELRYYGLEANSIEGVSLVISDGVNDLTGVLRLYNGNLELVLVEGSTWFKGSWNTEGAPATVWRLESKDLQALLDELLHFHASFYSYVGAEYDFERIPLEISYGNAHFTARKMTDWDYELVEYSQERKYFGIRIRPKEVTDGWVYFSFWPERYEPQVEKDCYMEKGFSNGYSHVCCWPASVKTSEGYSTIGHLPYYTKISYPVGDYVEICEGTEAWPEKYIDVVKDAISFVTFTIGKPTDTEFVRTYGEVTVDLSQLPNENPYYNFALLFFNWDTLMEGTGATEIALLAQQTDGDDLYLAGEYDGKYCFLHFAQTRESVLEFRNILYGDRFQHRIDEDGTETWYADFASDYVTMEDARRVLLITDERVTGLQCSTGQWDYLRIDQHPALIVLNPEDWNGMSDYHYSFRYDDPPVFYFDTNLNLGSLFFREVVPEDEEFWYLCDSVVSFYDGVHMPGGYSLSSEELEELKQILVSLPKTTIVKCAEPEESELHVVLQLTIDNGKGIRPKEHSLVFTGDGEKTYITLRTAKYGDWREDIKEVHFLAKEPALRDFMEKLCDNDRKSYNIGAVGIEETIRYSHGDGNIVLNNRLGWEFEIVEYTDEETPFGIRCRPKEFDEGWLFFSYWPQGFPLPEDSDIDKSSKLFTYGYDFAPVYPSSGKESPWIAQVLRSHADGDYVIFNEGADSWLRSREDDHYVLINTFGSPPLSDPLNYAQSQTSIEGPGSCLILTDFGIWGHLDIFSCWMYCYEEDAPAYRGFRFWPEWETEGYIRFSSKSEAFVPQEGMHVETFTITPQDSPITVHMATQPGEHRWNYLWIDTESGSLLWENAGTEHWPDRVWQEVMEMIQNIQIARVIP